MYFIEEHLLDCHSMYSEQDFHCKISEIIPELLFFLSLSVYLGQDPLYFLRLTSSNYTSVKLLVKASSIPAELTIPLLFLYFLFA